jgi:hypothetical protein
MSVFRHARRFASVVLRPQHKLSPFGEVGVQGRIAVDGSDRHEITKHLPVLPARQLSTFGSDFTKATTFDIHNVYPGTRQAPVAPHTCSVRHYGVPPVEQYINLADLDQTKKQRHCTYNININILLIAEVIFSCVCYLVMILRVLSKPSALRPCVSGSPCATLLSSRCPKDG